MTPDVRGEEEAPGLFIPHQQSREAAAAEGDFEGCESECQAIGVLAQHQRFLHKQHQLAAEHRRREEEAAALPRVVSSRRDIQEPVSESNSRRRGASQQEKNRKRKAKKRKAKEKRFKMDATKTTT